jgi:hypothetical protein
MRERERGKERNKREGEGGRKRIREKGGRKYKLSCLFER